MKDEKILSVRKRWKVDYKVQRVKELMADWFRIENQIRKLMQQPCEF